MAHVSTEEYWDAGGGGMDDKAVRIWHRAFKVLFTDVVYEIDVLNAPGMPARFDQHPADATMLARSANAGNLDGDPFVWKAIVEYSSHTSDGAYSDPNPLNRPTEIETLGVNFQKPMFYDKDGKAVLNSAGDPFDPEWMMEDSRIVIRMSRFEAVLSPSRSKSYRNAVNIDSWTLGDETFETGELMCMYINQRRHFESGQEYWHTAYEFHEKENGQVSSGTGERDEEGNLVLTDYDGWDAVVPDIGYNRLTEGIGSPPERQRRKILTAKDDTEDWYSATGYTGTPVAVPVRLDGYGYELYPGAPFEDTVFKIFKPPYRYRSFGALSLP